jgi:hypothetical protein
VAILSSDQFLSRPPAQLLKIAPGDAFPILSETFRADAAIAAVNATGDRVMGAVSLTVWSLLVHFD